LIATQGRLFSHIGDACCYLVCVLSFRHHSLSLRKMPLLFRQQHSLSLLRRSLTRSVCSNVPAGLSRSLPPAVRALRIALNFSPQKAGTAAGRPATRTRRRKGPEPTSTTPSSTLHGGRNATSDPPPRPRSRYRKSSSRYDGN
jgi:hypothetical protein